MKSLPFPGLQFRCPRNGRQFIKTYDEKNILKKEKDQLLETLHTKMIGSIAADSNAEMNRVNAELYPDGSRKVCP